MPRPGPRGISVHVRLKPDVIEVLEEIGNELVDHTEGGQEKFLNPDGEVNRSAVVKHQLAKSDRRLKAVLEPEENVE